MSNETDTTQETPKKASKKASSKKTAATDLSNAIVALELRIAHLEKQNTIIVDGFEFAANETRPLFGFGAFAVIFDAIVKKLRA